MRGDAPVEYGVALEWQRRLLAARRTGAIPDTLLLLEHPPVITVGRACRDLADLLSAEETLRERGIALAVTDRGGEMTYHAPGQLVGYPVLDLMEHGGDLHRYLRDLEQTLIDALGLLGVAGERKPGLTGVWVGDEKICAIGIKVSRWIAMHGFALNIDLDLAPFGRDFVPCGIRDKGVTSLARLGIDAGRERVEAAVVESFAQVFDAVMTFASLDDLAPIGVNLPHFRQ